MEKLISAIFAIVCMVLLLPVYTYANEWVEKGESYAYKYDDGTFAKKGWLELDGKKYYIQKDSTRKTGWLQTPSGAPCYFTIEGPVAVGWLKLSKGKYYFDKNGIMQTGYKKIGKKIYRFDSNGLLLKQVKRELVEIDGKFYYCHENGSLAKGMVDIPLNDGTFLTMYFGEKGYSITGEKEIDGVICVFDEKNGLLDAYIAIDTTVHADIKYKNEPTNATGDWSWNFPSAELRIGSLYYEVDCISEFKNSMNRDIRIAVKANVFDEDGYIVGDYWIADVKLWKGDKYKNKKTLYLDYAPSKIEITEITVYFI